MPLSFACTAGFLHVSTSPSRPGSIQTFHRFLGSHASDEEELFVAVFKKRTCVTESAIMIFNESFSWQRCGSAYCTCMSWHRPCLENPTPHSSLDLQTEAPRNLPVPKKHQPHFTTSNSHNCDKHSEGAIPNTLQAIQSHLARCYLCLSLRGPSNVS